MLNHENSRWTLHAAFLIVFVVGFIATHNPYLFAPRTTSEESLMPPGFPRTAAGDLAFDRFLDQVIAGQSPSGTLPAPAPPTLRGTFLAVRALQQLGYQADINSAGVQTFIQSCYDETSHLFGDEATNAFENGIRVSGYSAIEGTYYALQTLALLSALTSSAWQPTADALLDLQDGSGGFACRTGICTTHDAYFAYKALELLESAGMVDVNALASFLDGRQLSDPARWWEFGAFINLPSAVGEDTDFSEPNVVTSYHAVATLAACGRLSVLNEPALVQFMGLLRNASSGLYSYATGNERAEHVGTAHLLAIDQYLSGDGNINYTGAGTGLIARIGAGYLNEGRKAPANHTLSAVCEIVWGLFEGGRLPGVSPATKENLRTNISLHLVTAGSMAGYALTRLASFHELASLLPAITGAGKVDALSVDALYAYVKGFYCRVLAYFTADGTALLQRDLPACYNPSSPDGAFAAGIVATLPALQVLAAVGRLNDFLGETHDLANILGNITASQFVNASAPAVTGAFCPQESFADECTGNEGVRAYITPQWTVQALEAIAILDPTTPTSHFNASAAWRYLSQFYVQETSQDYFTHPSWMDVSDAEWTCRVASALCQGGMEGYFNPTKVNAWVISHIDGSSACEVSWHLKFIESTTGLARASYAISTLNTLKDTLVSTGVQWYHGQGGTWPDADTVGILAQFRADRQIYLLNMATPDPMILGGDNAVSVDVSNLFAMDLPSSATITFSAFDRSIILTPGAAGHYSGSYQCSYDYSRLGLGAINFTASRGGWHPASEARNVTFAGTLVASVTCGGIPAENGSTLAIQGSVIPIKTTLETQLGASKSPAQFLDVNLTIYAGGTLVAEIILAEGTPGIYSGTYGAGAAGTYEVEVIFQGKVLARFNVTLDGSSTDLPPLLDLASLPAGILVGSSAFGLVILGAGKASRKRVVPANDPKKSP